MTVRKVGDGTQVRRAQVLRDEGRELERAVLRLAALLRRGGAR